MFKKELFSDGTVYPPLYALNWNFKNSHVFSWSSLYIRMNEKNMNFRIGRKCPNWWGPDPWPLLVKNIVFRKVCFFVLKRKAFKYYLLGYWISEYIILKYFWICLAFLIELSIHIMQIMWICFTFLHQHPFNLIIEL